MIARDVRRRLRRRADELGLDFQQALQYFAIERFLFRVSQTGLADKLIVKGATMLRVWGGPVARPTRDIDFLGRIDNSLDSVRAIIRKCLALDIPIDGLVFEETLATEQIALENRYPGVRVKMRGNLDGARFVLRLDIGIGDTAVPDPGWVDYPPLLDGPSPRILAYHPATAVAEEFEALVILGTANSRLKDFYDIWMLATTQELTGQDLRDALAATFTTRGTGLPSEVPVALTEKFFDQEATRTMWRAFTQKLAASGVPVPAALAELGTAIIDFVMPAAEAAASDKPLDQAWTPGKGWH